MEAELPNLLKDEAEWSTVWIDYEKPYVARVWREFGDYRVNLHCIYPCEESEALMHPHPWPSVMKIHQGKYIQAIAWGSGNMAPPIAATIVMTPGSSYEMSHIDSWHRVAPVEKVFSLMVTRRESNHYCIFFQKVMSQYVKFYYIER